MLAWSTLVLAVFTVVLAGATVWYAIEAHKMNQFSKTSQRLLEEQNGIARAHNESLKQQSEAQRNLAGTLEQIAQRLVRVGDGISDAGQAITNFKMMFVREKFNEVTNKHVNELKPR